MGPLVVGWFARHGRYATEVDNMSHAIAGTCLIYLMGAALLLVAAFVFAGRDLPAGDRGCCTMPRTRPREPDRSKRG